MRWSLLSFSALSLIAGFAFGDWFPDIDQRYHFLTHRSILTHGLILPLLLYSIGSNLKASNPRLFISAFSLGLAIHLGFDLFPKSWQGFALIHVPSVGWIHPILSWSWIAGSMICCLYLAMRLVRKGMEGTVLLLGSVILFVYTSRDESGFGGPLFSILVTSGIALIASLQKSAKSKP